MPATWLIEFTDDELEAIYNAIEGAPPSASREEHYESVIEKITPAEINAPPAGAVAPREGERGV